MDETLTTVQLEQDSTRNIARRYGYLFRLPPTYVSLLLASLPLLGVELITRSSEKESVPVVLLFAVLSEGALILTVEIDLFYLRRKRGLAIFRRLATISILSNLLWFALGLVGQIIFWATGNPSKILPLIVLGAFFAIAFRAIILGSVFFQKPIQGLPLAVIQPAILFLTAAFSTTLVRTPSMDTWLAILGGITAVAAIEIYLGLLNKPVKGIRALPLLQAFLDAWTAGNPADLEHYFQLSSVERHVTSEMVRLFYPTGSKHHPGALLVVPGIHPGPFSPVGSSNLPGDLYSKLRNANTIPVIFHSISDHDLNLPSKEEVRKYAESLGDPRTVDKGRTISSPAVETEGKSTASGFALGKTLLITLTLAPHGMEDLPEVVRSKIEEESSKAGFAECLVADSHNSLGLKPDEIETQNLIRASTRVIQKLEKAEQPPLNFGFAHSSEIASLKHPPDVGPAGVSLLLLQGRNSPFCLVVVDANNSKLGFREEVMQKFSDKTSQSILEICTSDTHVTAAKAQNEKGYLALGDVTTPEQFTAILEALLEKARSRIAPGNYEASEASSSVRTIGNKAWDNFSGLLDGTMSVAKHGAEVLGILAVLLTLAVAIL